MDKVETSTCGVTEECQPAFIELPLGLLGFEKIKRYLLVANPDEAPFKWLQVPGDTTLAFLVVNPFEVLSDYRPEIGPEDVSFLGLASPDGAVIYSIVTLRPDGKATVNLKGPIVVNRADARAKQVILTNAAQYAVQHPLPVAE